MNAAAVPTAASVDGESRHGWYTLSRHLSAFGGKDGAARKAAERWRAELPDVQRCNQNGRWLVRGDAVLPNAKAWSNTSRGRRWGRYQALLRPAVRRRGDGT